MSYLALDSKKLKHFLKQSTTALKDKKFDTIAVRGNSGLLMAPLLAVELKKNIIVIRKSRRDSHSSSLVEGWGYNQKILLLDDFCDTGKTLKVMKRRIMDFCRAPKIVGAYLYTKNEWRSAEEIG